ncbi:MAG: DUF6655 family protein [Planctomycetota bacterium]
MSPRLFAHPAVIPSTASPPAHAPPMHSPGKRLVRRLAAVGYLSLALLAGCGTTRKYEATEQLVISDAVDQSVSQIDFRPLSGRKVYLDASYLRHVRGSGFVNAEYVISSLRQQIVGAGCLIQDGSADADIIIEARLGTLGMDDHRVTFGVPENNALANAVNLLPNSPSIPSIPEIAFIKREAREAAAKVVAFAYDRETRSPIWQSGVGSSVANARDTWVLGVGPIQGGSVRKDTKLAGHKLRFGVGGIGAGHLSGSSRPPVDYTAEVRFQEGWPILGGEGPADAMIGSGNKKIAEADDPGSKTQDSPGTKTDESSEPSVLR